MGLNHPKRRKDKYNPYSISKAIDYYQKAIENGNKSRDEYWFQTHQQLTMLLARNNRANEAIETLSQWLKDEPSNIQPYISIAFAYKETGKFDLAYKYIKKAEKFEQNNVTQLTIAGDICKHLGKYDEAITYWDKAYEVNSEFCSCLYSKAFLFEEIGDTQKAVEAWQYVLDWHIREGFDIGPELELPIEKIKMLKQQG